MALNKSLQLFLSNYFYIAGVVFLITRSKILVWYKMLLPASNSLNLLKLVENELQMTFSENI